jgi:phage gp46-like protein
VPLSLRIDPKYLDADLVALEEDVAATEAIIALCSDARVDEALLPAGKENRGHWADVFEREQLGSKCWLLEDQVVNVGVAERLDQYAREALRPILDEGRITTVETDEVIDGQHLDLITRLTFPSGAAMTLGPIRVS